MTTITKERIELFIKNPLDNGLTRGEQMELARIALASLEAEPVGAFHIAEQQVDGTSDYLKDGEWPIDNGIIEVYAAPPVPVVPAALPENDDEDGHDIDYLEPSEVYSLGRTAGWNACRAAMLHGAEPVSQTYNLPELIEGMEVSIDVSTCDADLGNRYFGTVTEALELDTAKNGYILLVQDAEPNFDVNGNSPVTPDSWISCSERMPGYPIEVLVAFKSDADGEPCLDTGVAILFPDGKWRGGGVFYVMNGDRKYQYRECVREVTHWMPIPEPPQEMK